MLRSYIPQRLSDDAVDRVIEEFVRDHGKILEHYANSAICLPLWTTPAECSDDYADFITSLKIPCVDDSTPCLVLHDLWPPSNAQTTMQRLENLFKPNRHT